MILITGATGFIGSHLIKELDEEKIKYKFLSRRKTLKNSIKADFLDRKKILEINGPFKTIIHLGGIIDETDKKIFEVNELGTKTLIKLAEKLKVKKFIFVSTNSVNFKNIKNNYVNSKRKAEIIVQNSKLNWTIIRPSQVYGENEKRNFRELISFIRKSPVIPIINGPYSLQPVHVNDIVKVIIKSIDDNITNYKIYNLSGPELFTLSEIEKIIIRIINKPKIKIFIPEIIIDVLIKLRNLMPEILNQRLTSLNSLKKIKLIDYQLASQDLNFKPCRFKNEIKYLINKY